jgi:hypothetical protein
MDPQGSAAAAGKETAGGGLSSTTDENRSGKETSIENMMKNLKLTAAEADRLVDDDEEETEKPMWALAGKSYQSQKISISILSPPPCDQLGETLRDYSLGMEGGTCLLLSLIRRGIVTVFGRDHHGW